jgi:hypothetical protein
MTAYRFRWALLFLALICLIASLWWLAVPLLFDIEDGTVRIAPWWLLPTSFWNLLLEIDSDSAEYAANVAGFLGVLLLAQWMFLRPRRGFLLGLGETARPMRTAVVAAGFLAMMLTVGAIATLLELTDLWNEVVDNGWYVPAAAAVVWLVWAVVFFAYWRRGTRFEQLRRMAKGLIAGSVLELLVAAGVYAWKPDTDDCWCARGSYTGLVLSATVMIWAFGPGLIFLFLREARYSRAKPQ